MKSRSELIKEELAAIEAAGGVNPHHFRDGKWGGFGPSLWVDAENYGYGENDVLERDEDTLQWTKIWVNANKKWRLLTEKEIRSITALFNQTVN